MNTNQKIRSAAKVSTRRRLRHASGAGAVVAMVAAAVAVPIAAPQPAPGAGRMIIAIARADCPPDCGPGGGGTPSGPPGGGTEFVPPSMPATPSYEPGRGQPSLDQNSGISIYNSSPPQPSQASQPDQQPVQNQDGTYNRAANGEQQPVNYSKAPENQQVNPQWQERSDQLNNSDENQSDQSHERRCDALLSQFSSMSERLLGILDSGGQDPDLETRLAETSMAIDEEVCGTQAADPVEGQDDNEEDPQRKPRSRGKKKRSGPIEPTMWTLEECQRKLMEKRLTRTHICVPTGQAGMYYHGGRWAQPPVPLGPAPPLVNGDMGAGGDASNRPPGALTTPGPTAPAEPPPPYTPPPLDCGPGYHKTGEPPGGGGFPCRPDDPGYR